MHRASIAEQAPRSRQCASSPATVRGYGYGRGVDVGACDSHDRRSRHCRRGAIVYVDDGGHRRHGGRVRETVTTGGGGDGGDVCGACVLDPDRDRVPGRGHGLVLGLCSFPFFLIVALARDSLQAIVQNPQVS